MAVQEHVLVQDAGHGYAVCGLAKENDMLALRHSAQTRPNIVAGAPEVGIGRQQIATTLEFSKVDSRLGGTPSTDGVGTDVHQIALGELGIANDSQVYCSRGGKLRDLRTLAKTSPVARPLRSPASIAARSNINFS